jgi:hypothetical protein
LDGETFFFNRDTLGRAFAAVRFIGRSSYEMGKLAMNPV